jgi:predicted CXXCH cytochrome family protein
MVDGDRSSSAHAALQAERGRSGCLACHDPHLSDSPALMRAAGPVVCRECHAAVVEGAEAPTGHAPAAEDCLTCHRPHAAEQPHLLRQPAELLCRTCHDYAAPAMKQVHLGAEPATLRCNECHSPHGAGQAHLLWAEVHSPVKEGCDLCHLGSAENLVEGGGEALCSQCHEVAAAAAAEPVPHAALELAGCSECHNPHASAQSDLVRHPGGQTCSTCHPDQAPATGEISHPVIDILGCQACHQPHGGEQALLRKPDPELCLACHDPRSLWLGEGKLSTTVLDRFELSAETVRAMANLRLSSDGQHDHPTKDHRVLGELTEAELKQTDSTFRGEFTCLTCHDPHKGRSALLRWDAATPFEACAHCHAEKAAS